MRKIIALFIICGIATGCSSSDNGPDITDNFNRSAMLANWADNIIVPAYQAYVGELNDLKIASDAFISTPSTVNLNILRTAWTDAYLKWQRVSMFEIGKAEALTLRNFTNIFPADASNIDQSIAQGNYDLTLSSTNDEQGFPALDYLLNGVANDDASIVNILSSANHKSYLNDVVARLRDLATEVLNDWTAAYRDTFVASDGSTATSSVNKMVNDYMFYYEKSLRAGKIGIPAGIFSTTTFNDKVEAFYKGDFSKALFLEALNAAQDFFRGKHYNSTTTGESLESYLSFLNTIKEGTDLSELINNQFNASRTSAANLSDNFSQQVTSNNMLMLQTYDQLQMNVVLLKVDMFQALSIQVDFVDADGD